MIGGGGGGLVDADARGAPRGIVAELSVSSAQRRVDDGTHLFHRYVTTHGAQNYHSVLVRPAIHPPELYIMIRVQ